MSKYVWLVILLLSANAQADTYYRSIDKSGKVHYGDQPLAGTDDVAALKLKAESSVSEILPFETRRAKEKFPVTLYLADECPDGCKQARDYLVKRGIPFTEKKMVTVEDVAAFKKETGSDRLPVVRIGKNLIKGFLQSQWADELDAASYPKIAPYGVRAAVKSVPLVEDNKKQ
jgi:glutaredoxin